jgi:dihydrolipoamide dehydrogenase
LLIGKFPFKANARARCSGDEGGFVKILGEKGSGRVIGLHIIGPSASEMIHEGVLAIEHKLTLHEIAHAIHAHPTCSEAIKEAALAALGHALHI